MFAVVLVPSVAAAQDMTRGDVKSAQLLATENYDLGEFAAARAQMEQLLERAGAAGLAKDAVSAKSHLILGAALTQLGEDEAAVAQFVKALELDKDITLQPPLNTEKPAALFLKAREVLNTVVNCDTLPALKHEVEARASSGVDKQIMVMVGNPLDAGDVVLFVKTEDDEEFRELPMQLVSGCDYAGTIPAAEVKGEQIEYYVAAKTKGGKMAAARGSARAPFVMRVAVTAESPEAKVREEDPDILRKVGETKKGGSCAGCSSGGQGGAGWLLVAGAMWLLVRRRG